MMQKVLIFVLVLAGWHCTGNQTKPPPPETIQTIKAEVEQMAKGPVELEKTLADIRKQIADTVNRKPTPEMKQKQALVQDLGKKMEGLQTEASELKSVLDGLVADYASGKISEEEFRKQFESLKVKAEDQSISAEQYIRLLKPEGN